MQGICYTSRDYLSNFRYIVYSCSLQVTWIVRSLVPLTVIRCLPKIRFVVELKTWFVGYLLWTFRWHQILQENYTVQIKFNLLTMLKQSYGIKLLVHLWQSGFQIINSPIFPYLSCHGHLQYINTNSRYQEPENKYLN